MKNTLPLTLLFALGLMARPAQADPLSWVVRWLVDNTTGHITDAQQRALGGEAGDASDDSADDEHGDTESDTGDTALGGTACAPDFAADVDELLAEYGEGAFLGSSGGLGLNLVELEPLAYGFSAEILVIDPSTDEHWVFSLDNDSGCLTTAAP